MRKYYCVICFIYDCNSKTAYFEYLTTGINVMKLSSEPGMTDPVLTWINRTIRQPLNTVSAAGTYKEYQGKLQKSSAFS